MKILLLNPSAGGAFRKLGFLLPPLGILYVAAAARRHGHEVRVVDRSVDRRPVDPASFDVVGIHSDTTRYAQALALARAAKAAGARVVLGGPHPCFVAAEIFATGAVDAVVRGEGEETFPELLAAWSSGSDPRSVPGLLLPAPGGALDTGQRERIRDLDALPPPARDLLDLGAYAGAQMHGRPIASLHTSRGCPSRCRFCSSTQFDGAFWRARSAEGVVDEVERLSKGMGFGAVAFMDDNFTRDPRRVAEISEGILRRRLDVLWWCFSRVDTVVRNPGLVELMARAGARSMFIGVESPNERVLRRFHKGIAPDQAREAVRILRRHRIEILASFILGAPEEDRRDFRSTIRFARELDTDTAQFTLLTPYPGTDLYEELRGRIVDHDWSHYDSMHAVFDHPRVSRTELQLWLPRAYASFYLRHRRSVANFYRFLELRRFGLRSGRSFLALR